MIARRLFMLLVALLVPFSALHASAQEASTPQTAADAVRNALFDAQTAVMFGDSSAARTAIDAARTAYDDLREPLTAYAPQAAARIEAGFAAADDAIVAMDTAGTAAARAAVSTAMLGGAADAVFALLEVGEIRAAGDWLLVREFRPSTKFSRPGADASLAVVRAANGVIPAAEALAAVRADLLDTYQAQVNLSLADADEAAARGFTIRQAEETALAAGYFEILAAAYGDQRGAEALNAARASFAALASGEVAARAEVDAVLVGFRAAPLSQAESARRAGQLLRFITLVPVEYERGVRNGVVANDIEIQEALTFREGAAAAFTDIRTTLNARDPEAAARVDSLLAQTLDGIRAVVPPSELQATVDAIHAELTTLLPAEWQTVNSDSDVDVITSVLDQIDRAAAQGEYAMAESARLEAYAILELGMEQRLRGFAPDRAVQIEGLFWSGTAEQPGLATLLTTRAPIEQVEAATAATRAALIDAQTFLSAAKSAPEAVAGNAAIIVFREGLEAVLILASLLASLRTLEERRFRRPIIMGAAMALIATAGTWWLANQLLLSLMRYGERLEAIVSLVAIGVLLVITNWFFHKVYWVGWMASFHQKKRRLLGGVAVIAISQTVGLVVLGFSSIYREGFETVLFLQSLVLEAGIGTVIEGTAIGMVGVVIVGAAVFALQMRLPYKKMLIVTGVFIGVVLLTMVGNTVHVMQAVGWMPITPIAGVNVPFWMSQWLGVYATWQTILLQAAAATFVIGSYVLAERQNGTRRRKGAQKASAPAAPLTADPLPPTPLPQGEGRTMALTP